MPKIIRIINRLDPGGPTFNAALLTKYMAPEFETMLLAGVRKEKEDTTSSIVKDMGLEVVPLPYFHDFIRPFSDLKIYNQIRKHIKEFKPDIVHTHAAKAGALGRLAAIHSKVPVIVHTFHGHHLYDPEFGLVKRSILNMWERRLAKRTDAIVTIGERVKRELLEVGIGKESQYISIPPGISDLKLGSKTAAMKKLGIAKERRPIVVWLGRFTEVKRPDRVIELAKKAEGFFFVMAGGGELEESIRASAPANVLVAGWQKKEEMWAIADIALCTSDSEGMPLSLIEAQMAGIPVVSTYVGSVDEIVVDGVTGRLGKRDVELLSGLEWVKTNQKRIVKKSALSRKIKKLAHEKFKVETMATAHRELYRKLGV